MVLIGLISVAAVLAVGVDVWQENSGHVMVQGFGHTFSQSPWVILLVGAVCGALLVLGLALIAAGAARRRQRHREHMELLRDRDRLAREIEAERASHAHPTEVRPDQAPRSGEESLLALSTGGVGAHHRGAPSR